jgi:methyl-accepting chemotaxis protein
MKTRRSQVIIKKDFQQKLIVYIMAIAVITFNVILMIADVVDAHLGSEESLISLFYVSVGVMELLAVAIIYYLGRDISFHIAGPMYALERTLRSMGEGKLDQTLKLRARDHFVEVSDELNRVISDYRERIYEVQELARQLDASENSEQSAALREKLDWFVTESETS